MRKAGSVIVGVLTFLLVGAGTYYLVSKLLEPDVQTRLAQVAKELNKQAPVQVDQETRLDSAAVTGNKAFDYYYTLIYRADMVDKDTISKYIIPEIVSKIKSSPDMSYFREHEITLNYTYYGYDGNHAITLNITPDLYKN